MLETEFEQRIEELKAVLHGRATEFQLWLHVLQSGDGSFWPNWTLFFWLDGARHHFNSRTYDELKTRVAEVAGVDNETREMLLAL